MKNTLLYIDAKLYDASGESISSLRTPRLYAMILDWYRQNICDIQWPDDSVISGITFNSQEDLNLFRLAFEDKCYIVASKAETCQA